MHGRSAGPDFPSVPNMAADGNPSAKGKSVVVVFDYEEEIGSITGYGGGSTRSSASFPLPFSGGAAGGIPRPQHHVRTACNPLFTGMGSRSTQHHDAMHDAAHHAYYAPNSGRARSPLPWTIEQMDSFIGNSLRSLSIRDGRGDGSLFAHARGGRRRLSESVDDNLQEPRDLAVDVGTDDGQNNNPWRGGVLSNNADHDHYVGRRLEDVRGAMTSVARNTPGCRFLVRMVAEGGAAAAQKVLGEVAREIVRLMVHAEGHALVEALVQYLTDEDMARVLEILDAASPAQIHTRPAI